MSSKLDTFIDHLSDLTNDELNVAFAEIVHHMIERIGQGRGYQISSAVAESAWRFPGDFEEFLAQQEETSE